jgi:hypothetical protein
MAEISFLNLPPVPEDLCVQMGEICKYLEFDEDRISWMHEFHQKELTLAGYGKTVLCPEVNTELVNELETLYSKFFPTEKLYFILGHFKSYTGENSVIAPHCDAGRITAINFLLQLGGTNVETCFYHELRNKIPDNTSDNLRYKDVTLDFKSVFPEKTWHCFDTQTFHSVENIESNRFLFAIVLQSNPTYEQFVDRYKQLVIS